MDLNTPRKWSRLGRANANPFQPLRPLQRALARAPASPAPAQLAFDLDDLAPSTERILPELDPSSAGPAKPPRSDLASVEAALAYAEEQLVKSEAVVKGLQNGLQALKLSRPIPGEFPTDDDDQIDVPYGLRSEQEAVVKPQNNAIKQHRRQNKRDRAKTNRRWDSIVVREKPTTALSTSTHHNNRPLEPLDSSASSQDMQLEYQLIQKAAQRVEAYRQSQLRPGVWIMPAAAEKLPSAARPPRPPSPPPRPAPLDPAFEQFYEAQRRGETRWDRLTPEARAEAERLEAQKLPIKAHTASLAAQSGSKKRVASRDVEQLQLVEFGTASAHEASDGDKEDFSQWLRYERRPRYDPSNGRIYCANIVKDVGTAITRLLEAINQEFGTKLDPDTTLEWIIAPTTPQSDGVGAFNSPTASFLLSSKILQAENSVCFAQAKLIRTAEMRCQWKLTAPAMQPQLTHVPLEETDNLYIKQSMGEGSSGKDVAAFFEKLRSLVASVLTLKERLKAGPKTRTQADSHLANLKTLEDEFIGLKAEQRSLLARCDEKEREASGLAEMIKHACPIVSIAGSEEPELDGPAALMHDTAALERWYDEISQIDSRVSARKAARLEEKERRETEDATRKQQIQEDKKREAEEAERVRKEKMRQNMDQLRKGRQKVEQEEEEL